MAEKVPGQELEQETTLEERQASREEQEFLAWKSHPVTSKLLQVLRKWQEGLKDDWAEGHLIEDTEFKTAITQAKALGNLQACKRIEELDYETLQTELSDD